MVKVNDIRIGHPVFCQFDHRSHLPPDHPEDPGGVYIFFMHLNPAFSPDVPARQLLLIRGRLSVKGCAS
jgi:hypothetical protein